MTAKTVMFWVRMLILQLMLVPPVSAAPPASAQAEIRYLLAFVGASGCHFYRNGSWYDSKKAQEHLRDKYDRLAGGNQISTAEDFIEKVATKSSLSDQLYKVRCSDVLEITTNQWLADALNRYRAQRGPAASGADR